MSRKPKTAKTEYKSYWEKLRDPRWQMMRLEIMKRDSVKCQHCGAADKTLNVHHKWYDKGRDPWDYPQNALETLCERCHEFATNRMAAIARLTGEKLVQVFALRVLYGIHSNTPSPFQSDHIASALGCVAGFLEAYETVIAQAGESEKLQTASSDQTMSAAIGRISYHLSHALDEAIDRAANAFKEANAV